LKANGLALFHAVKPMLASRRSPEEMARIITSARHLPFVIETKFDGERLQTHKDGKVSDVATPPVPATLLPLTFLNITH
jgi:ATP-dependent DNA ligase